MLTILDSNIICKQPGRYIGWPTVAKAPDGTLYAVFSGDRDAHVCPFGKVFFVRSIDNGVSWSTPENIVDTPLDDRDAGICVCPDGTIVVTWFTSHFEDYEYQFSLYCKDSPNAEARWATWQRRLSAITKETIRTWAPSSESPYHPDYLKRWMGFWTKRSKDGGKTWDEPTLSPVYAPHGPTVLKSGDLFFVGMRHIGKYFGPNSVGAARSTDQGKTWNLVATIPGFPTYDGKLEGGLSRLAEPHVVEAASGKLIAMARFEQTKDPENPRVSRLWQFESEDGGLTWTTPYETKIAGKPPHLSRLSDGTILVSYGHRDEPRGQHGCISLDEGNSWLYDQELIYRTNAPRDLGYTSAVECNDGTLVSVYYQVDKIGEPTCLMVTRSQLALASQLVAG